MPKIACPHCRRDMQVRDSLAGQSIRCPTCSGVLTAPMPHTGRMVPPPAAPPPRGAVPPPLPPAVTQPERQYFYSRSGQQHGPIGLESLKRCVASGAVLPSDMVWTEGMPGWTPISSVPALAADPWAAANAQLAPASRPRGHLLAAGIAVLLMAGATALLSAYILLQKDALPRARVLALLSTFQNVCVIASGIQLVRPRHYWLALAALPLAFSSWFWLWLIDPAAFRLVLTLGMAGAFSAGTWAGVALLKGKGVYPDRLDPLEKLPINPRWSLTAAAGAFSLVCAAILAVAIIRSDDDETSDGGGAKQPSGPTVVLGGTSRITKANYDRIRKGMTLDEVEDILGPGDQQGESSVLGNKGASYVWRRGARIITVQFVNGEVYTKAQTGL